MTPFVFMSSGVSILHPPLQGRVKYKMVEMHIGGIPSMSIPAPIPCLPPIPPQHEV